MNDVRQQPYQAGQADRPWLERIGWKSVDDVLACSFDDVVAVSQSSDVACVPLDATLGGPTLVFVKRYYYRRRSQRIMQMFRGTLFGKSRARREYEFLNEMLRRGVPVVRPIAFGDRRRGLLLHASFIITEGAEGAVSLDLFVAQRANSTTSGRAERTAFIHELAATIRAMHQAGTRHGGLFWRNILVHLQPGGGYRFSFLDPDTHAKLLSARIPQADAIADLSEFAASGMAAGTRIELLRFAKAYLGVRKLGAVHRSLVAQVIRRANGLASRERNRLAATECLDWLRRRIADRRRSGRGQRKMNSLDEFFSALESGKLESGHDGEAARTIHFSFVDEGGTLERSVTMDGGRFKVGPRITSEPDLLIRSDPETWLALLSGQGDAYERVQAGRLLPSGDVRLLLELVKPIDEALATD